MINKEASSKAVQVTGYFEGGGVTGNFDNQGLSMGLLQWNIGTGTLIPILQEFFNTYPQLVQEWQLQELQTAVNNGTAYEFTVNTMNAGGKSLIDPWLYRLNLINDSAEFKVISLKYCDSYLTQAISLCNRFGQYTDRAFALMFDIAVQCWTVRGSTTNNTLECIANACADGVTGEINGSNELCKADVRKRKLAIVYGCDQGRGWPGVVFDDTNAFVEKALGWQDIIALVSSNPALWDTGIASIIETANADGDSGPIEIFKNTPALLSKVYSNRTGQSEDWTTIIRRDTTSPDAWINGINLLDAMAEAKGDLGDIEIFKYFKELITKINALAL